MRNEIKKRRFQVLRTVCIVLCAGLLYAVLCRKTGFRIPCPVYMLTGLRCPGCGVSRMCLALLSGNVRQAFLENRAILLLLPVFGCIAAAWCKNYIQRGERVLHGSAKWCAYIAAGLLLAFGAVRNFLGW